MTESIFGAAMTGANYMLSVISSREFKICDATVTKTSFKIAISGLLIFFVIMSACLTSKN